MIRGNSALRARRGLRAWLLAAFAALPITAALAATQYLYDDLGRLVLVANADGSAAVYAHDENGNVLSITQWAASGPVIAAFSPMYGHAGTTVTILGTGFSATPANNTVTIGGVAAAVSASTTTTIASAIPQGANTGPITVTVDSVTATSAQNITVYKPLIASFSPGLVAPSGSVTVTGGNLNLVSGGTSFTVAFGRRGGAEQFELLERIPAGNFGAGAPLP
jgi:YD repeat-containing protein